MLKIENVDIYGWEAAIKGMRNPMESHHKSDTWFYDYSGADDIAHCHSFAVENAYMYDSEQQGYSDVHWTERLEYQEFTEEIKHVETIKDHPYEWKYGCKAFIGPNDYKLMQNLCKGGSEEAKWRRFVHVTCDITAPLYWLKEADTYRAGVEKNSCSTMHKIHAKEFTLDDFSHEHLITKNELEDNTGGISLDKLVIYDTAKEDYGWGENDPRYDDPYYNDPVICTWPEQILKITIAGLNYYREKFLETKDKHYWYQMIQLLPSSYNQRRTYEFNYESLANIYRQRKSHKLDDWVQFSAWVKELPYSEFITLEAPN